MPSKSYMKLWPLCIFRNVHCVTYLLRYVTRIIFLFLSSIYCCITWHYWSKGHQRNKEEFDLKEKKPLHSSTVFWDLGLLEFMKADGFPVVRKGCEDHTAKGMRCQGRNISSILPNATAQVLVVYEKKDYRKCSDLCFTPVTASPSSTGRCTGPERQLLCHRITFFMSS